MQVKEVGSGAGRNGYCGKVCWTRLARREIDVVLVWRLDRWGAVGGGPARDAPGNWTISE